MMLRMMLLIASSFLAIFDLRAQAILDNTNTETHNVCKHQHHETKYDPTQYKVFNSPDVIYPIKYKLGIKYGSKHNDHDYVGIIRQDTANWDIVTWHLKHYINRPEYMHCVDAGGNFGFFSLHMASLGCKVSTFDIQPVMTEVELYLANLNGFHHGQMHIYRVGLSDKPSIMRFEGDEGTAFLTSGTKASSSSAYTAMIEVPVTTGDLCLHKRKMALVKIDVEGFEVRTVNGMHGLISDGFIEAFHIEIGPARWDRANLTTQAGVDMLMENLSKKYHVNLILRNHDTCEGEILEHIEPQPKLRYELSGATQLVPIDWKAFSSLIHNMVKRENDCNFYFSPWQLADVIPHDPLFADRIASVEGRVIAPSKGRSIYKVVNGTRRAFPNWDTFEATKLTLSDVLHLDFFGDMIPLGPDLPSV